MFVQDVITGGLRIVAPGRAERLGRRPDGCPFCAGNEEQTPPEIHRLTGTDTADTWRARAVPNLFPLSGVHEVLIPTPRHVTSMRDLTLDELVTTAELWIVRLAAHREFCAGDWYAHLFVNDGKAAGASLEHSHAQLVAMPRVSQVTQLTEHVRGEAGCVACALAATDDALHVAAIEGWTLRAHASPRTGGGLLAMPREHDRELTAGDAPALGAVLHALVRAASDGAFNLWLVHDPTRAAHPYLELVPRTAVPAGVELALGIGVSILDPNTVAADARERLKHR